MPVYKDDERGTWYCEFRYKEINGFTKKKKKRGFKTKKEAVEYERNFLAQLSTKAETIFFKDFAQIYLKDIKTRIKPSSYNNKEKIFKFKLIPFFENILVGDITPIIIRKWQNEELKNNYKKSYFVTIQKEMSAIMNYAVKFYNLPFNPVERAGQVSDSPLLREKDEIKVWNLKEFNEFIKYVDNCELYTIFNLLYFTGARIGEILALNHKDFNFKNNTMRINKSYQKINGKEHITTPKTKSSIRTIKIPNFLCDIVQKYLKKLYDINTPRIFNTSRTNVHRCKNNIIRKYNLKKIRLHDFRHSHASILLNEGVNIIAVSKRLGHESVKMTLDTYAHLMDKGEGKLIETLEKLKNEDF